MAELVRPQALQRCLFRAQMDSAFAEGLFAREAEACASAGLNAQELELLLSVPLAGVTADPQQSRRLQMLGNVSLEFRLSLASAEQPRETLEAFIQSAQFHSAVDLGQSLPLAFAGYLEGALAQQFWPTQLCKLEHCLAQVRRARSADVPIAGHWQTSGRAEVTEVAAGCVEYASALQHALSQDSTPPSPPPILPKASSEHESVLCFAATAEHRWQLASARPEVVAPTVARLLSELTTPRDQEYLTDFAADEGANFADLAPLLAEYCEEGVLLYGGGTPA